MRAVEFTHNLRDMKRFMSFAAILATLLFSMTFVMESSAAVVAADNPVVANPVVMTAAPPVVSKSDAEPFFRPAFNPFFRPAFNPFFGDDFGEFGFEEDD